jgi:hypothetical protein
MTPINGTSIIKPEDLAPPMPAPKPPEMPPPPGDADAPGGCTPPPIRLVAPAGWATSEPPPSRYLLDGLLPLGAPAILAAKSNAGKSLLAMQISFAVATGRPLFGRRGPTRPLAVLFVELEDDPGEVQRRFRRCLDLAREDPTWTDQDQATLEAHWRFVEPVWTSTTPKTLAGILPHLLAHAEQISREGVQLGLVILDTFAALSEGDENKAETLQGFWPACHSLATSTGGTPLVIHHVRKLGTTATGTRGPAMADRLNFDMLRGSTAIVAGARAVIQLEPLSPDEASKLNLDSERAAAGNYLVLALTKNAGGPKGSWIALEQREASENGAGFFTPLPGGDRVCASLRSKAAVATLTLAENVFLTIVEAIDAGREPDRKELARRHWPGETPEKAEKALKTQISHMRTRHKWLQSGRSWELTVAGFTKAQELKGKLGDQLGDFAQAKGAEGEESCGFTKVSNGNFAGDVASLGTVTGSPAAPQMRLAPPVPEVKVSKSPTPYRGERGDLETFETDLIPADELEDL